MNIGRCFLTTTRWLQATTTTPTSLNILQTRSYAARKGTRERKKKAKGVKVEVAKVGFIPHNMRNRDKLMASRPTKKFDDSMKRDPIDDVFAMKYYKWIVYSFADAVQAHRETHHPEMYNRPDAPLYATIELNMQGEKKTRFVDNFKRVAAINHSFDHGDERSIIVFAKDEGAQQDAVNAGAHLVGGVDLIKQIQNGQVVLQDFKFVASHPDILPELSVLRGIMKKNYPNPKHGTLSHELGLVVHRYLHGISYQVFKDDFEKDFGQIDTILGPLDMDPKHLEENFASLINDVQSQKPKRTGTFITRCLLWSPPSREKLKIDHNLYIKTEDKSKQAKTKDEDEEQIKEAAVV